MKRIIMLLRLVFKMLIMCIEGYISFKYLWNYDFSQRSITLLGEITDPDICIVLEFHKELILVSEDLYKIVKTDDKHVNKFINKPMDGCLYSYSRLEGKFHLLMWPSVSC